MARGALPAGHHVCAYRLAQPLPGCTSFWGIGVARAALRVMVISSLHHPFINSITAAPAAARSFPRQPSLCCQVATPSSALPQRRANS
ncbi:MAG: hypothetical protein EAY75_04870 [Bacteroidetes bacterium]|nr:MAG: hypothetical protein EAY75_04870 [Bacteroidota bacterium]